MFESWLDGDGGPPPFAAAADVPSILDTLPDGRDALITGDVSRLGDIHAEQGDNPYGFLGTCGICSCREILRQFGVDVSEADLVDHAVRNGLCVVSDDPTRSGGTTGTDRIAILAGYGISAHAEQADTLDELARNIDTGHGVIIGANAGVLWDDIRAYGNGGSNHAVTVTGVARDPGSGEITGFFIDDSARSGPPTFVDADTMRYAWLEAGGNCQVTDATWPGQRAPAAGTAQGARP